MAPPKRRASGLETPFPKKPRNFEDRTRYKDCAQEIEHGIVLRKFYPPEMSNQRAHEYVTGKVERPIETLNKAVEETQSERGKIPVKDAVVHWFKCDLRTADNKSLHLASKLAASQKIPLICLFVVSPQDWNAHLTAPVRVDYILRTLEVLRTQLDALEIPLHVETVEKRRNVPTRIIEMCKEWGVSHVFCNAEYEVDELRREAKLTRDCLAQGISFNVEHDSCVVEPGQISGGAGGQLAVYTPWFRRWIAYVNSNPDLLDAFAPPAKNPPIARQKFKDLFNASIPEAPMEKKLAAEEKQRFKSMWPTGEHEAQDRLEKFFKEKVSNYSDGRNFPSGNGTSVISPHLAVGTIAARTCVRLAQEAAPTKKLADDRRQGHAMWISEVAWRDFYKHVLAHWPHVCMNKPFKVEYANIEWEYSREDFEKWTAGKTGYPIVDAAMRQINHTGYMHNRCRMIVASFLAKHLMLDWRMGERYFMEHLIDGDFASNNGGWGWSASSGVDPQPYFRIFNPLLQSEKFDPDGVYIRKWVPELAGIKDNKAIHDPYGRGMGVVAKKGGYPKPIVEHRAARERALARYKAGVGKSTS